MMTDRPNPKSVASRNGTLEWLVMPSMGHVVKRIKIIMGNAAMARRLDEFDQGGLMAEFGNNAPQIGIRVMQKPQFFHHLPVVKSESGVVLDDLDVGQHGQQLIVLFADNAMIGELSSCFFTPSTSLYPSCHLVIKSRISSGGSCRSDAIKMTASPPGLHHAVKRRTDVAEVAGVDDELDPRILSAQLLDQGDGPVFRGVVDINMFVVEIGKIRREHITDAFIKQPDVGFFLENTA